MQYSVVTTFHEEGLKKYGQRMIDTFCQNWPKEIKLYVYAEKCVPRVPDHDQVVLKDSDSVPELSDFKNKWKDDPKARGWCNDSTKKFPDKTQKIGFRWDAIRFSNKVYAIFDCAKNTDADVLLWMDADTVCHSPITLDEIARFVPENTDLCYLGREGKYSECGLYSMSLNSSEVRSFLKEFQRVYDDAENGIFLLDEWHDSFVFDDVRKRFSLKSVDWSAKLGDLRPGLGNSKGEGHPLINSQWGAYLDHLKGDRKDQGRSPAKDLKVKRTEAYWK